MFKVEQLPLWDILKSDKVEDLQRGNANHPFAGWLIDRAPEIAKRYPGIFERLRWVLFGTEDFFWSAAVSGLNGTLDRLRELHPAVRPPENLVLTRRLRRTVNAGRSSAPPGHGS